MEEHNINIDLMRCVACVAVVAIHVVAVFWYSTPISLLSFSEYWENFMLQQSDFIVTYKILYLIMLIFSWGGYKLQFI